MNAVKTVMIEVPEEAVEGLLDRLVRIQNRYGAVLDTDAQIDLSVALITLGTASQVGRRVTR